MKTIILIFFFLTSTALTDSLTLAWDYPTEELPTNIVFHVWTSNDVNKPLTNWTVCATVPSPKTTTTVPDVWGWRYFSCTASNEIGRSDFSNIVSYHTRPRPPKLIP